MIGSTGKEAIATFQYNVRKEQKEKTKRKNGLSRKQYQKGLWQIWKYLKDKLETATIREFTFFFDTFKNAIIRETTSVLDKSKNDITKELRN